jgi:multiple sugar transport system substrate-binding protein
MGAFTLLNRTAAPTTPAGKTTPAKTTVTLEYWGLWEPLEVMTPLIEEYQKLNSTVKINYTQQKTDQYRQRVQAAIRQGNGPDIFRYHNTWLPMVYADLTVAPAGTVTAADLQQSFYPIVGKTLASTGKVYGVPLMYEGLALIYNKSILEAANAQPPQDWEAVRKLASTLTIRNGSQLERSGIALGTSGNVDNFSDILATMMLQNAADPGNPSTDNAEHALSFYTIFRRVDQVWDETQPNSTVAFANEKVAMIVAPSWRIADIQKLNPNLRIGVSRLPQLPGTTTNWASFWVEGVSKQSAHAEAAWKFLAWLSQPAQIRKLISAETAVRGYGEISPRSDMAVDYQNDPLLKPYLEDAQSAQSWYMASMTHDEGLNDQMIQYYADAVNAAQNGDSRQALTNITPGIQQILSQYQITVQSASK